MWQLNQAICFVLLASVTAAVAAAATEAVSEEARTATAAATQEGHITTTAGKEFTSETTADFHSSARLSRGLRRILADGGSTDEAGNVSSADYAALNAFLDSVSFGLPDAEVTKDLGFLGTLDITLKELVCTDLSIDDVDIEHDRLTDSRIDVSLGAGVDLICEFDYYYVFDPPFLRTIEDDGKGKMYTVNNRFDLTASFGSENFDENGPTNATVTRGCDEDNPVFNVESLEFSKSVSSTILNVFEGLIKGIVEDEIKDRICVELEALEPALNGLLDDAEELLEPYYAASDADAENPRDPLEAEKALIEDVAAEEGVELFDFTKSDTLVHQGVQFVLEKLNEVLGGNGNVAGDEEEQPNIYWSAATDAVSTTAGQTPGVNNLLRLHVLNDAGVLDLTLDDQVLYNDKNSIMDAKVTLSSVRIIGLDTIKSIEPLRVIGRHTFQSRVSWDALYVEADIVLEARPSSDLDAIVLDAPQDDPAANGTTVANLREEVTVKAGLRDLEASLSFLLALDTSAFGNLKMGSLFYMDNIAPCLLSSIHAAEVTQFRVSAGDIIPPTLEGFLSDGLSKLITQAVDAAVALYEPSLLHAMPNVVDDLVTPVLNDVVESFLSDPDYVECPSYVDETEGTVVDLRDLLLSADDASLAGGYGSAPYGDLLSTLKGLIDDALFAPASEDGGAGEEEESKGVGGGGAPKLNDLLIGPLAESQSGTWGTFQMEGDIFHEKVEMSLVDLRGTIELGVSDITVKNMDSVGYPLGLLDPVEAHVINNTATVGVSGSDNDRALILEMGLLIAMGGERQSLRNELKLRMEMSSATVAAAILAKIDEEALTNFPLRDALNPWCWLSTMPAPSLTSYGVAIDDEDSSLVLRELGARVEGLKLELECVSCTSQGFLEFANILSTPEAANDLTNTVNEVMAYVSGIFGGEFLQTQIDRALREAETKCPHHRSFDEMTQEFEAFEVEKYEDDGTVDFLIMLGIVVGSVLAFATVVVLIVRWIVRRRHRRWLKTLTDEEVQRLYREQRYEIEEDKAVDKATTAMILSKSVPRWIRWFMPIVIFGNVALFLSGHLSLGATVNIVFQLADEPLVVDGFFDFTMAQTTIELWNAGAKVLAILILIFSIIWPYTKQILTLAMWCLPPSLVSTKFRENMLLWLDTLGKWSMVDIFVLIVALVAFRVSVTSPSNLAFLPLDLYSVDLLVVPLWGLYSNMTAQLVSQLSSHAIIHYHRKIVAEARRGIARGKVWTPWSDKAEFSEPRVDELSDMAKSDGGFDEEVCAPDDDGKAEEREEEEEEASRAPLRKYLFGRGDHKEGQNVSVVRSTDLVLVALSALVVALVVVGCTISSFQFEILGAVGLIMEVGQDFEPAVKHYSVFGIVGLLFDQARFMDSPAQYVGLGTLSVLLVLTSLVIPLLLVGYLLWLWFAPTTGTAMKSALVKIEVVKAWQYLEVYILSVIIAAWQVGGLSAMMVNEYCGSLDETFSSLVYYGIIKREDAQCFYASSKVEAGTFVLMAAAVLLALLGHFVTKAAAQKLHEQERNARRGRLSKAENFMADTVASDKTNSTSSASQHSMTTAEKIVPVPVQFVDSYRWFVVYNERDGSVCSGSV